MTEETQQNGLWALVLMAVVVLITVGLSRGCIAKNKTCRAAIASGNQAVMNDVCRGL